MSDLLAVIAARGNSKGVPRKNLTLLSGEPLLYWTIKAAKESNYIDRIVVSSEDDEILEFAKKCGISGIPRPKVLSQDTTLSVDVVLHAMDFLKEQGNFISENVVLLQPTSPLRTGEDIDKAFSFFVKSEALSLISGYEPTHNPLKDFSFTVQGELKPLVNEHYLFAPRQQLPKIFRQNGAIYIAKVEAFIQKRSFFTEHTVAFSMSELNSLDIDQLSDFEKAELLMKRRMSK